MSCNKYIHYGTTSFNPAKFQSIKNRYGLVKPSGGFWASPIDAELGWRQFCEKEDVFTDELEQSFEFTLTEGARVFHIKSVNDLEKLPGQDEEFQNFFWYCIDFEKAAKTWDAVELHLTSKKLYDRLYGWDCDSILIMNKDIIVA